MRILFLTQVLPYPLDAGPKVRAYYTLRYLAERGHEITLLSFVRKSDTEEAVLHLGSWCEQVVTVPIQRARWRDGLALGRSLITGEPLLMARDRVEAMYARVRSLVRAHRFDAVHADQLWMAPYALAARAAARPSGQPRLVLDQHNAVYLIPGRMAAAARNPLARLAYRRESSRMRRYEARACLAFDQVVTVTEEDWQCLLELYRGGRRPQLAGVIPICVGPEAIPARPQQPMHGPLLFVGGMHWPPNADGVEWFAQEVMPLVRTRLPQASLTAVGKQPPASLANMAADGIHLPGYVEDLQPYWERCGAFIVPLRAGGGMRVKILDAWAHGVPVVSTQVGAEGLAYSHGENVLIADSAEQFSHGVVQVLTNPELADRLARGGRRTVEERYNWQTVYAAWDAIYADQSGTAQRR